MKRYNSTTQKISLKEKLETKKRAFSNYSNSES